MAHYHFWLLDEADERTQGLELPCGAEPEAWLVADRLLAECRSVEIWAEGDLIGRIGAAPASVVESAGFVWPDPATRRRARGRTKSPRKPAAGRRTRKAEMADQAT